MSIEPLIAAAVFAVLLQFFDASVGMGFGIMTPILLLLGFGATETVSAVIFASMTLSLGTGIAHHTFKNVEFGTKTRASRVALTLAGFGILGAIIGATIAITIPEPALQAYIAAITILAGILVIKNKNNNKKFSWKRLIGFGTFAAFNKGIAGGAYGPVVTSGQIVSGMPAKKAVPITALAESIISAAGFTTYILLQTTKINWYLILAIVIGGALSTPIAAYIVKETSTKTLKKYMGLANLGLGILLLTHVILQAY